MKKILVIISLNVLLVSYKMAEESNYLEYHLRYNKIEESLVNEKFYEAQKGFEELFKEYEVKFVKDYVIAAQVNFLIDKKEQGLKLINAAMRRGVQIECLKSIKIIEEKVSQKDWQLLESQQKECRRSYLKGIDLKLYQEFHKRYQEEQESKGQPNYKQVVYSNFKRIKKYLEEHIFLGEEKIGIDNRKYARSISTCDLGNSKVIVSLLHYDYPISEIGDKKMIAAIKRGELHPREYATIYTYEANKISILYKKSKKEYEELPDYKFNFPFGKKIEDLAKVNKDRKKFGICNYQIDLKKKAVVLKYGLKLNFNYK